MTIKRSQIGGADDSYGTLLLLLCPFVVTSLAQLVTIRPRGILAADRGSSFHMVSFSLFASRHRARQLQHQPKQTALTWQTPHAERVLCLNLTVINVKRLQQPDLMRISTVNSRVLSECIS